MPKEALDTEHRVVLVPLFIPCATFMFCLVEVVGDYCFLRLLLRQHCHRYPQKGSVQILVDLKICIKDTVNETKTMIYIIKTQPQKTKAKKERPQIQKTGNSFAEFQKIKKKY